MVTFIIVTVIVVGIIMFGLAIAKAASKPYPPLPNDYSSFDDDQGTGGRY